MINRKILLEKMQQFGIDWIGSSGFLDEGQVSHVLDIVEKESAEHSVHLNVCPRCNNNGYYLIGSDEIQCELCRLSPIVKG